jgi:hypothetical protein
MVSEVNYLEFPDLFEAWKGINIFLATHEKYLREVGRGGLYGPAIFSYNNFIRIKSAKTYREDWDIARNLGYSSKKWTALVKNYVDMNYVDLVKNEVNSRKSKKARSYNYSLHFKNKHGSGKDCLICLNFTKRIGIDHPIAVFTVRTSEVTKRLIFDFVLVQRLIEYVYGPDQLVELHFTAPAMFLNIESFCLFNNVKPIAKIMKKVPIEERGSLYEGIEKAMVYLMETDLDEIKWKVNRRSAEHIQKDIEGNLKHSKKGLELIKLQLPNQLLLPKEVITNKEKTIYLRNNPK